MSQSNPLANPTTDFFIVVKTDAVHPRTIPARGDRAAMHFREQRAAIEKGQDFPVPFNLQLAEDQRPYPPGRYTLDLSCVKVNKYEGLEFDRRISLTPVAPTKA